MTKTVRALHALTGLGPISLRQTGWGWAADWLLGLVGVGQQPCVQAHMPIQAHCSPGQQPHLLALLLVEIRSLNGGQEGIFFVFFLIG